MSKAGKGSKTNPGVIKTGTLAADKATPGAPSVSNTEDIRHRAYAIFLARSASGAPGDAFADWMQAEREVLESARHESSSTTV